MVLPNVEEALRRAKRMLIEDINTNNFERFNKIMESQIGIDISLNSTNMTCMMHCAANGSKEMLECILKYGPNINQRDTVGRTALHYAARAKNIKAIEVMCQLPNIELDAMTVGGMTPLMFAVQSGDIIVVKTCLESLCNPLAKNAFGETAKDMAEKYSQSGSQISNLIDDVSQQWV